MADERKLRLEIAHVLFVDIVGYSKLSIDEQSDLVATLNEIVQSSDAYRKADEAQRLVKIPTGDGMALIFYDSPESPAECAMDISRRVAESTRLKLRMGVHSGPVSGVVDVNGHGNVAGEGINLAQRVMDCGDAGHILLSKRVATDLAQFKHWRPHLHDLGACEVKHGVRVELVNLFTGEIGNSDRPAKLDCVAPVQPIAAPTRTLVRPRAWWWLVGGTAVLVAGTLLLLSRFHSSSPAAVALPLKSIAVLPFESLSEDKANAFFADGVQDEILTDLAKIADLKVISRTSVMQYKSGVARNLRKIADELGVAHVLEGSVQRSANKVRVNAQLIDARNDAHLWAQSYDRDLADVFAIQSEIATTIADQLSAKLSSRERKEIAEAPTTDLAANDLYQRATKLFEGSSTGEAVLGVIQLLEEAVHRDPKFAIAYAQLCNAHIDLYWEGIDHTSSRRELARVALQKAQELRPDAGEVHLAAGTYAYHGFRDYERARQELESALRLLPNYSPVYLMIAAVDRRQARWEESMRHFDRAVELDPLNFSNLSEAAFTRGCLRKFEEARPFLERARALDPKDAHVRMEIAMLPYNRDGELRPWHTEVMQVLGEGRDASSKAALWIMQLALAERNAAAAATALENIPAQGLPNPYDNSLLPREWYVGLSARTFGGAAAAATAFKRAREIAAQRLADQPDYAGPWALLGACDAALGRKDDAINEAKHACELLPLSKDAMDGSGIQRNLALVYTWVGEKDRALEALAESARIPGGVSYGELKLTPEWDALRGDPRFDAIVASLAPRR